MLAAERPVRVTRSVLFDRSRTGGVPDRRSRGWFLRSSWPCWYNPPAPPYFPDGAGLEFSDRFRASRSGNSRGRGTRERLPLNRCPLSAGQPAVAGLDQCNGGARRKTSAVHALEAGKGDANVSSHILGWFRLAGANYL